MYTIYTSIQEKTLIVSLVNMFLAALDKFANTPWLMVAAVLVHILCTQYMSSLTQQLGKDNPPPDIRFGYTSKSLNAWYDAIGEDGCKIYQQHVFVDLFPYMQSYTLVGGALLLQQLRIIGWNENIALIFPMVMLMDMIETCIPAYGCSIYPEKRLRPAYVQASASANQLKWTNFGIGMSILSILFVYNSFFPPKHDEAKAEEKTD